MERENVAMKTLQNNAEIIMILPADNSMMVMVGIIEKISLHSWGW